MVYSQHRFLISCGVTAVNNLQAYDTLKKDTNSNVNWGIMNLYQIIRKIIAEIYAISCSRLATRHFWGLSVETVVNNVVNTKIASVQAILTIRS